ncbi:hypothetical protein J2794_006419 [Paraburkholderia terricola]|uniref:beta strand repeat-containing protein n=1 Tax=Paraburkholderia terricola TaxID=169427 RepID=UPI002866568B|nr:hypothetical protein [Paraburkholderia terricola]MDR6450278.1 hypothetical protein [Paraburkholderia terricola]
MATVTTAEGAAALINFLVNGTVSSADAANSAMQALSSSGISADAIISATGAIADVGGIGASSVQMFQQFASNSAKAGALAGAVATSAAGLSVAASAASMVKSVYQNGFGSLTASQFDALSATLLAAGAIVAAPEAAIALGVLAAGMTAFGWSKQANDTTVSSALAQLQGIVQKYYASLSSSDQATFNSSLGNAMQSTLSGGMMVPQVNGTGEITGYAADVPVSVVPQSDGSTLYTFSSGVTYSQGSAATFGPLVVPSGSAGENVWTIPQSGTTDPVKLGIYGEGSYSDIFKDSQGNAVAEVYIAGTSGTYSIAPTSGAQFINDVGSGNQVVATAGSFIDLKGGNNTAQVSGATVLAGSDVTSTINGDNDTVDAGSGSRAVLYGTSDVVNLVANGGSLVNIMQANSSDTVNGAGNIVGILASGDNVTASGETFNFSAGGFTTRITGNGDIINAGSSSGTLLYGTGDIVNFYANSGSLVNIMQGNSSDTVNGAGNTVGILGSGDNVTASGDTFNFSAGGFATAITGNGDIINAGGGSGTLLYGTGDIVNFYANSGSLVNIMQGNSSDTVNGAGNTVGILGAGDNVTASGDTFNFSVGGFTTAITGNSDIINAGGGSSTVLYGTDDIVNLIANSGSLVNIMQGNSSETVNGAGNTIGVLASGDSVAASGDTINSSSGTSFNLSGGNDTVSLGGTGDYLGLLGGAYSVSGTGATINTWAGTSVNLSGGNDTVGLGGSGDYLGLLGGSGYSVTATSATINTWGGTTFNLSGNNDTVGLGGTGDYLGLLGGTYLVNGSGDTINTWNNTSVALSGSGNTLGLGASSALSVTGDGNTIGMGSGSSLVDDGINNTINASGSEIVIGAINRNQTIYIYGNNDYIDASAVSDYIHTTIEVIGTGNTVRAEADTINFQGDGNSVLGGYNNLLGSYAHQVSSLPSNLNTFPGVPVSVGSPASGSTDSDGVQTYPVETPPITVTPLDETQTQACPNGTDPIILNLNGGAVDTTSLASSSTSFDMQNDGHKVQTAWGTAGEGYLVFDPNDAGNTMAVTQDSQLVAGFGALQALAQQVDGSGSGTLTASDALWNSLKVWVDTTGSGQFQSGELYSLSQLGITSLDLDGTQVNRDSNGNEILVDSTFTRADGSTGDIAGVNLMYNADATASASTVQTSASLADLQISNLIAGMASYGAQPAASSTLVATAQRDPHTILAASLH